jgi:hypothetical protein
LIEIADHTDALRIRRPNCETCSAHAVDLANVRAELFVNAPFVALTEQIQILFAERGKKGIRIARLPLIAARVFRDEIVGVNFVAILRDALEDS